MDRRPLHVTMAIQTFAPIVGGGELQLERLLAPLAERGIHTRVVTRAVPGVARRGLAHGADVMRTRVAGESPAASVTYVAGGLIDLARPGQRVDVVHAHGVLSPATIALGASFAGVPAVVTPLGAGAPGDLTRVQRKPGGRRRLRALVRRANFVALSTELANELYALGVDPERVHLIPNGFDARRFRPASAAEQEQGRRALDLPHGRFCFVFVGRLHAVKRVETAICALASVPDAELIVVGDGPELASLERVAANVGVMPRVRFVGVSDRVDEYLRAADAFVLPSLAEGMSNALVEAMACGLPCLVTASISGVDELLGTDRGDVVASGDVDAWAGAMRRLRDDQPRAQRLGAAAARYVHESMSLDHTADRLAALYRKLARR
ncbi:MAG: hypothetical protein QOI55_688 [Actinomycetota bacterium]|nr:hypothetical protein [Actinomycetota bacterium]